MAEARKNLSDESGRSGSTAAPSDLGIRTADGHVALPDLVAPSASEAQYYYLGLPSRPRLVGRTSSGVVPWKEPANWGLEWMNPLYDRNPEIRLLTPIGGPHRALHLMEGILPQIKGAISVLPWTSIDLLRIGSSKVRMMERPVVLWIGVQSEKQVAWDNVARALRQVRVVLDSVHLTDIECEIRVADTAPLQSDPPPLFAPVSRERFGGECYAKQSISTALGLTIVPSLPENKAVEGTLGAYLRPAGTPHGPVWALTCRHVCLPLSHHENECYRQSGPAAQKHPVYSPSDSVLDAAVGDADIALKNCTKELQSLQPDPAVQQHPVYSPSDKVLKVATRRMENRLGECEERLQELQTKQRNEREDFHFEVKQYERQRILDTLTQLHNMRPWPNREIGSVFYSPAIAAPLAPDGQKRWTRDWGLVRLSRDKFPAAYTKNEVDIRTGGAAHETFRLVDFLRGACRLPPNFALPRNGLLPIAGVVPMAELEWICSGRADRPAAFWCQPNTPEDDAEQARAEAARAEAARAEAARAEAAPRLLQWPKHAPPMPMLDREKSHVLVVGKRGSATGLTWGVAAEFQSVVRIPYGSLTLESRGLAIIGTLDDKNVPYSNTDDDNKNFPFSAAGDSGSLVFDITGRAVALLTTGAPAGQVSDITYCTPLALVLEDVSKALGETVVLV